MSTATKLTVDKAQKFITMWIANRLNERIIQKARDDGVSRGEDTFELSFVEKVLLYKS